jgi:hypothetical protein
LEKQGQANNPYDICTWRPISECSDCAISGYLKCRFKKGDLLRFIVLFLAFSVPAFAGMVLGGYGWHLLGWVGLAIIFFGFWEIRVLCSHCPYYAEKGMVLHCIANYGCPKFWKYRPEPINNSEKIQLAIGLVTICGYPFPFMILGGQIILFVVAACGLLLFFSILVKYTCSRCVNFSCFLNRAPQNIVDEYLKRNPVVRKAWKDE